MRECFAFDRIQIFNWSRTAYFQIIFMNSCSITINKKDIWET